MTFADAALTAGQVTKPLIVFVRTVINPVTHIVLVNTAARSLTPVVTCARHVVHGDVFVLTIPAVLFPVVEEKGRDAVTISTRVKSFSASADGHF